eukprot:577646-Amphidinium_carterae.1
MVGHALISDSSSTRAITSTSMTHVHHKQETGRKSVGYMNLSNLSTGKVRCSVPGVSHKLCNMSLNCASSTDARGGCKLGCLEALGVSPSSPSITCKRRLSQH